MMLNSTCSSILINQPIQEISNTIFAANWFDAFDDNGTPLLQSNRLQSHQWKQIPRMVKKISSFYAKCNQKMILLEHLLQDSGKQMLVSGLFPELAGLHRSHGSSQCELQIQRSTRVRN